MTKAKAAKSVTVHKPARHPAARASAAAAAGETPARDVVVLPRRGSSVDDLLSGKVIAPARGGRKDNKKKEKPVEKLPGELGALGDVLVAGRKIAREIDFKVKFAEQRVKEHCLKRFCERFAETGVRPESAQYASDNSVFTFIQTRRINLTPEKAGALKELGIPVQEHTSLKGLRVNFDAIREHKLETKLRDALESIGVPQKTLLECFQPEVQFKESFFDQLALVVERSLAKGEKVGDKLYEVVKILDPAEQIRNAETPNLGAVESFKLIHDTEIDVSEDLEALDD